MRPLTSSMLGVVLRLHQSPRRGFSDWWLREKFGLELSGTDLMELVNRGLIAGDDQPFSRRRYQITQTGTDLARRVLGFANLPPTSA